MTTPATRTPVSWVPPESMTFDAWQAELDGLLLVRRATPWLIGDCLVAGEAAFGQEYSQALPDDRLAVQTLANYKTVAGKIAASRRREGLSFGHHDAVAGLEPAEQDRWLDRAEAEKLSRASLRQAMKALEVSDDGQGGDGEATEPEAEILPPKASVTEYPDEDEDQLESLKRAWKRAGQEAREQFLEWTKDYERPVFDAGERADPDMPKFLRRRVRRGARL